MCLTWLNLRVNATTLGAELCFSFLFQPQLDSSWKQTNNQGNLHYECELQKLFVYDHRQTKCIHTCLLGLNSTSEDKHDAFCWEMHFGSTGNNEMWQWSTVQYVYPQNVKYYSKCSLHQGTISQCMSNVYLTMWKTQNISIDLYIPSFVKQNVTNEHVDKCTELLFLITIMNNCAPVATW